MTRRERLDELVRVEQGRHRERTGMVLRGRDLVVHFGMSPAEFFADDLDAEDYDVVSAVVS